MVCCASGDPQSCGDRCDRYCPCISMYPSLCTGFLSLVFAALVAAVFGAYAFISLRISIFRFNWSTTWLIIVNASLLALIVTVLLLVLAIVLWFVCSSAKGALIFKSFYLTAMALVILALAAVMVGSILIIYGASRKDSEFARELEVVWVDQINSTSTLPCRVQRQLRCRGLEEGDCQQGSETMNSTRCGIVCRPQDVEDGKAEFDIVRYPGCRERIAAFYTRWNAILLAGTSLACILTLVAFFVTCNSVSFESDK